MSKAELRRLGGLSAVLAMLESPKSSVQESAILVLTNCTQDDELFCIQLMQSPQEKLRLLLSFLQGTTQFHDHLSICTICAIVFHGDWLCFRPARAQRPTN